MGTNFYWYPDSQRDSSLHIGKASAGWCFALATHPEEGIRDLPDWEDRWNTGEIRNEYGDRVTPEEMRLIILGRATSNIERDAAWWRRNRAVPGPGGLARHAVDGISCVGHGTGTYDLIHGEFS